MDSDMVDQVIEVSKRVIASGAISANGHGNVSLRVPGGDEMYFTAGSSLRDHPADLVALSASTALCARASYLRSKLPWSPCTPPCTPISPTSAA